MADLPPLSHLQCLVLDSVGARDMKGRDLRAELARRGIKKTGPAFYQAMSRLEEADFIEGWYEQKVVDGQTIKERTYKITGEGAKALRATLTFYAEMEAGKASGEGGMAYA